MELYKAWAAAAVRAVTILAFQALLALVGVTPFM
jgi:hypothetical protein